MTIAPPTLSGLAYARIRHVLPSPLRDGLELFMQRDSVLRTSGWLRGRREGAPVDASGAPLPWYTYAAIRFLEPRIRESFTVFEYGAGHSTLWWASRVASVTSVEYDQAWADRISERAPANVSLSLKDADYAQTPSGTFDIIVIDGIRRPECAVAALPALASSGIIVWDNAEETADEAGPRFLEAQGFRRLDFWGLGPQMVHEWCTSIFYRWGNCLDI